MKYLGINLTKEVQELYTENCIISLKQVKDLNKWKDISYSWIIRFNIFKMAIHSKLKHRLNAIFIRLPAGFLFYFVVVFKVSFFFFLQKITADSKSHMELQETSNSQNNLEKE